MLSQLFGAVLRAILVFFVIATPSLVLGDTSRGDVEGVMLFGLIAALFVVFEYSARHPAIIEFRDAPPYHRLRILALTITLGTVFLFALFIRFSKWPGRGMSINMWVNLPMFDPTVGSDVTHRLKCDARRNIIWGLGLPLILSPVLGLCFRRQAAPLPMMGKARFGL